MVSKPSSIGLRSIPVVQMLKRRRDPPAEAEESCREAEALESPKKKPSESPKKSGASLPHPSPHLFLDLEPIWTPISDLFKIYSVSDLMLFNYTYKVLIRTSKRHHHDHSHTYIGISTQLPRSICFTAF